MGFFFRRRILKFKRAIFQDFEPLAHANSDGFIAAIIDAGKATLSELRTIYSLEDAYDLYEIIAVSRYNNYLANQSKARP